MKIENGIRYTRLNCTVTLCCSCSIFCMAWKMFVFLLHIFSLLFIFLRRQLFCAFNKCAQIARTFTFYFYIFSLQLKIDRSVAKWAERNKREIFKLMRWHVIFIMKNFAVVYSCVFSLSFILYLDGRTHTEHHSHRRLF